MTKLSVNINKIATLRNARGGNVPDVLKSALDCVRFGAQGITVHPRPDERHIRYQDARDIKPEISVEFNIEGNPVKSFIDLVLEIKPAQVTLVPDAPDAITSNAGWDTIKNKKYLVIFLVISCLNSFIGTLFVFLPTLAFFSGLNVTEIFQSFSIGYIVVAFFSIGLAFITPKSKKKVIYLIDLIFDVIPLGLILFSNGNLIIMSIAIILFISRDFIKPISMDYFYSFFDPKETDYIWGLMGTIPSLISFGFTLLIPFLIIMNWKIPIFIAIGIAVIVTIIAYKWLPSSKK